MRTEEVMTRDVVTVSRTTTVREAAQLMAERDVSTLPVLDGGRVVGVVSEVDCIRDREVRDVRSHLRPDTDPRPDPRRLVSSIMTRDVRTVRPHTDLADLADLMVRQGIRAVPVVDDTALVGIVSRRDLVRTLLRADAFIRDDVQQLLDAYTHDPGSWQAEVCDGVVTVRVPAGPEPSAPDDRVAVALASTIAGVSRVHLLPASAPTTDTAEALP